MSILENLKKNFQQESLTGRSERMRPAAFYGALIATAYTLTLSLVNVYTFQNLPLGLDWARVLGLWIGFSVAFAFFGAIAAWFTEEHEGIVGGGLIFTALLAIVFMFSSTAKDSLTTRSIIMALPLAGVSMLGAWGLRWAAQRHLEIVRKEVPPLRQKFLARHVLILILVGLVPGVLARMDLSAQRSIGQLHKLLQAAPNDPSVWPRLPLRQVPALQDHFGVEYVIYVHQSTLSVGALDVTVRFTDGYILTCHLPATSEATFITQCNEGDEWKGK